MPGVHKQIQNARIAAAKAHGQRVYISGIQGQQSLETGVAYHYRGHFVYAYPTGNPIEPIPFSTKKGINIIGTVQDQAPLYSPNAPNLIPEANIAALRKSCHHIWEAQKEDEEQKKREMAQAVEESLQNAMEEDETAVLGMPTIVRPGPHNVRNLPSEAIRSTLTPLIPSQVSFRARPRGGSFVSLPTLAARDSRSVPAESSSMAAQTSLHYSSTHSYTPHDRAQYLADSAPGSRFPSVTNTPHASRPVSPTHQRGSSLRQIASTSRLNILLAEDRLTRAFSPLSNVAEGNTSPITNTSDLALNPETTSLTEDWIDPCEIATFVDTVSRPVSPRLMPIGTSRPRRASMALNQAWNARLTGDQPAQGSRSVSRTRLPKCPLHGEECDGVMVTETWKTQYAKETTGFKDLYPVVSGAGDRVMVDWFRLVREEQVRRG